MSAALIQVHFILDFFMETNTSEQSDQYGLPNYINQTAKVVTDGLCTINLIVNNRNI